MNAIAPGFIDTDMVKTRLQLPKEQTDRVREVAGRLLREAPAFQRLLADLRSER